MPIVLQASMRSVPAGADTGLPSTVMFTTLGASAIEISCYLEILTQKPATAAPCPLSQRGTAYLPSDPQTLFGISSQWKSSAAQPRRPADRTFCPACFRTSIEYYQCPS